MTVAGLERIVSQLGIDKLLMEGVPQSTVDRIAPGVSAQDVNKVIGALDRMIPGSAMWREGMPMRAWLRASTCSVRRRRWKASPRGRSR
jgi:hypothetical protein